MNQGDLQRKEDKRKKEGVKSDAPFQPPSSFPCMEKEEGTFVFWDRRRIIRRYLMQPSGRSPPTPMEDVRYQASFQNHQNSTLIQRLIPPFHNLRCLNRQNE